MGWKMTEGEEASGPGDNCLSMANSLVGIVAVGSQGEVEAHFREGAAAQLPVIVVSASGNPCRLFLNFAMAPSIAYSGTAG
jgi:hypothetical protein